METLHPRRTPQPVPPSGTFTLLSDAAHATLPYLTSDIGMFLEDSAVLGECLSRISSKRDISLVLSVYETCGQKRTTRVVQRGNVQQHLYHLHNGPEQRERDEKMMMMPTPAGECLAWKGLEFGPWLLGYEVLRDVGEHWANEVWKLRVGRSANGKFSANLWIKWWRGESY